MTDFIEAFEYLFFVNDQATVYTVWIYVGAAVLAMLLRIAICLGYRTQYAVFQFTAKDLKTKDDVKNLKSGVLGKAARDYSRSCEKGIGHIQTHAIVEKHIMRLGLLFWKYDTIGSFVKSFEYGLIFIGLLLSLAFEYTQMFVILSVAAFIVMRVVAAFFDFEFSRAYLRDEIVEYIDREIGQFYIPDLSSSITRLKAEMTGALNGLSEATQTSLTKLGADLSGVLHLSVGEMAESVKMTIETITGYSEVLKKPMDDWKEALNSAADTQRLILSAAGGLEKTISGMESVSKELTNSFMRHNEVVANEKDSMQNQTEALIKTVATLTESNRSIQAKSEALENALAYIEKNQVILQESLNKYELSLESLTGSLGSGLGSMLEYQLQNSYNTLNASLGENIRQVLNANNDLIARLQKIFDSFQEQRQIETQTMIKIKEQMDMHFETLLKR